MRAGLSMHDLDGWTAVGCATSDEVRAGNRGVSSSLTDIDGDFGAPVIYTEWAGDGDTVILRDYLHPDRSCHHYVPSDDREAR